MRARLINPELVTIRPIARADTRVDTLAAEPALHQARGAEVQVLAQVDTSRENLRQPSQGGANLRVGVLLTFLRSEVDAAGWEPADGDLVVSIANRDGSQAREVRWYLQGPQHLAKEHHRAKLLTMDVVDRPPSRARTEGL